jgi:hypothetical protein
MNLRDALRAAVAGCNPLEMQHATFQENHATFIATAAQQNPAIQHEIGVHAATAIATAMQHGPKSSATLATSDQKLQVARPSGCNTQLGSLTAHRLAKELIATAMRRCDEFGDGPAAREQLRQECLATPPHLQQDLLDHFRGLPRTFLGDIE